MRSKRAQTSASVMLQLLQYAAMDGSEATAERSDSASHVQRLVESLDGRQLEYVTHAGLAPLLFRAIQPMTQRLAQPHQDALLGADLTARVRHGNMNDVATEVIDVCKSLDVGVTLLKGISIGDQYYPSAHLRPMSDIDILVSQQERQCVQSALLRLGYLPKSSDWPDDLHHAAPLLHPAKRVWVEVHSMLFSRDASVVTNGLFAPSQVTAESVPSMFQGRPVQRLSSELQLVYIAAYWLRDLSMHAVHPSFVTPLFDAIYLLKRSGPTMDWLTMLRWLDNEMATASLYVMLAYLARHDLGSSAALVVPQVAARQALVGPVELAIIHAMLDVYLIAGKRSVIGWHATVIWDTLLARGSPAAKLASLPWNLAFPPPIPERFTVRYQLDRVRRLAGLLRTTK